MSLPVRGHAISFRGDPFFSDDAFSGRSWSSGWTTTRSSRSSASLRRPTLTLWRPPQKGRRRDSGESRGAW